MTLVVENVKEEYLPACKAFFKALNAKCKLEKPAKKAQKRDYFAMDADGNVFKKSVVKSVLAQRKELLEQYKAGTLKTYNSAKEMHEDILKND